MTKSSRKYWLAPWLFLLPGLLLFLLLIIIPIVQSFIISFYEWDGLGEPLYIGWENFIFLFEDPQFFTSIKNNIWWLVLYLLSLPIGLGISIFLNQTFLGVRLVKSLFFFPFVLSSVVVGLVFSWFYDPSFGLLNRILGFVGLNEIAVLSDERLVTYGIIAAGLWPQIAYCMILYLTGLTNIDRDQIEAGRMDGAKRFSMLFSVVLPQLKPISFVALVVTMIGALRSFDLVLIMTAGGPYGTSSVLGFLMYEQAIFNYRMGYGSAVAVVLFLIMSIFIAFFLWRMLRDH